MSEQHVSFTLTSEQLWQFCLRYYAVREVKEACLALQNNYSGNVNLLLLLKYLDQQQIMPIESDWQRLLASIEPSETLLIDYRELRKSFKPHLPDTLYREALQFELALEKQQQLDLVDCINQSQFVPASGSSLTERYCQIHHAPHLYNALNHIAPQ
jgi:uncharacterized protein (TIGR02444 family)